MEQLFISVFLIVALLVVLAGGLWIGFGLMATGWVAMMLFTARPAGDAMVTTIWGASSSWTLTSLPMFIWIG